MRGLTFLTIAKQNYGVDPQTDRLTTDGSDRRASDGVGPPRLLDLAYWICHVSPRHQLTEQFQADPSLRSTLESAEFPRIERSILASWNLGKSYINIWFINRRIGQIRLLQASKLSNLAECRLGQFTCL